MKGESPRATVSLVVAKLSAPQPFFSGGGICDNSDSRTGQQDTNSEHVKRKTSAAFGSPPA